MDPWYLETLKCSLQLLGARKKIMTSILSQKTGSQPVGAGKKCFQAISKWKKLVPSYFEPDKHCCSYLEREKSGSLLFGDQKMYFTTVRSKEKDYDIYLKIRKTGSQQVGARKNFFTAIWKWKKLVPSYFEHDKHCCSYLEREKMVPCYLETKKCS